VGAGIEAVIFAKAAKMRNARCIIFWDGRAAVYVLNGFLSNVNKWRSRVAERHSGAIIESFRSTKD
jgi:hypothetical protein